MPSLTVSSSLFVGTAVIVGLVGSHWLSARAQLQQVAEFRNLVDCVGTLVAAGQWREPWESDPAWGQLERQLGLDLVPVPWSERRPLSGDGLTSVERSGGVSGRQRLTAWIELQPPPAELPVTLRVTREIPPDGGVARTWWASWGLMCAAAAGVVLSAAASQRHQQRLQHSVLQPWLAALRGSRNWSQLLPKIDTESRLEPALAIVAEAVNSLVAELHDQNRRSELVFGNLQEGVLAIDERAHVLLANQAVHQLLGLPAEPYEDRLLLELVRVPQVTEVAERVLKERAACEAVVELSQPKRTLRILGRPLPLNLLTPAAAPGGGPAAGHKRYGGLLTIRDETMLRRIEAIRRDFVANASHELKTPLAAIRAFAETLQLGALDDRPIAEQFVGNIIEQADRIHGLVQGMLQLSRVESGTALKFAWFEVHAAARPCVAAVEAVARGKSVDITCEPPAAELMIRCDRDGFQTILSNLLSNAVRYTHSGGRVQVSMVREGPWCVLRVTDTGIGIAADDLERIFERFYRAERDRATHSGGTGLGLSIVKHLTQALGGTVQATSRPGEGSCFEVRLPIEGR